VCARARGRDRMSIQQRACRCAFPVAATCVSMRTRMRESVCALTLARAGLPNAPPRPREATVTSASEEEDWSKSLLGMADSFATGVSGLTSWIAQPGAQDEDGREAEGGGRRRVGGQKHKMAQKRAGGEARAAMRYDFEEEEPEEADGFDDLQRTPLSPSSPSPTTSPAKGVKGGTGPAMVGKGLGVVRGGSGGTGVAKKPDAVESIPLPAAAEAIKAAEIAQATVNEEPRQARGMCAECGKTVWSNQARMKASNGEYYHETCVQQLMAAVNAAKAAAPAADARAPFPESARHGVDGNLQPAERGGRVGNERGLGATGGTSREVAGGDKCGASPANDFARRGSGNSNGRLPVLDLQTDERHAGMPAPTAPSWREAMGQPVEPGQGGGIGGWAWGLGGVGNGGGGWIGGAAVDEPLPESDDLDIGRGIAALFRAPVRASSNSGSGSSCVSVAGSQHMLV